MLYIGVSYAKDFFTFISFMIVPQSLTTPDMQKFDINNGDVQ